MPALAKTAYSATITWLGLVADRAAALAPGLPIFVTENGMAHDSGGDGLHDPARLAYVDAHLAQCLRAIAEGVDLRGYILWSLLDNYEWSLGYEKRFGLVHVDFDTLERRPKESFYALAARLRRGQAA